MTFIVVDVGLVCGNHDETTSVWLTDGVLCDSRADLLFLVFVEKNELIWKEIHCSDAGFFRMFLGIHLDATHVATYLLGVDVIDKTHLVWET